MWVLWGAFFFLEYGQSGVLEFFNCAKKNVYGGGVPL